MTPQEWLDKAGWEGGLFEGLEYGLKASDLDDSDPEFRAKVEVLEVAAREFRQIASKFIEYAEDKYEINL